MLGIHFNANNEVTQPIHNPLTNSTFTETDYFAAALNFVTRINNV